MANKETQRKKKYVPVAQRGNGTKLSKEDKLEMIDKIQDTYLRQGTINKTQLARDLKVNRATLVGLINDMNIEMESLEATKVEFKLIFDRIKNRLMKLWDMLIEESESEGKINIRNELAIIKEMKDTLNNFYSMLQEFGEAAKPTNKHEIEANITQKQITINYVVPNGSS